MMFMNVFRIGLQTVSWFQLAPDDSLNGRNEDAFAKELLTAHIQLQNEGRLSSWTISSDKGQKLKLWLFLPGRYDGNRPNLDSGLKVTKSGVWISPGNSTEVTAALCQALRNRFERALSAFAYVRFGSMFVKCKRYISDDTDFRRTLPSCEVTFAASEAGLFMHLRVRRRRMRPLAASDVRTVLTKHLSSSAASLENPAVVVAPYGLTGWLTGCCPGDLVRQISQSKSDASKEYSIRNSFPQASIRNPGFMSRSWYVEVRMRFLVSSTGSRAQPSEKSEHSIEKVFIFPSEAVLVPTVPPISARTYLKRAWLRKLAGTDWLEDALSLKGFSPLTSLPGYRLQAMGKSNTIWKINSISSKSSTSSGSGGSSIKSSDSRGTSGSESDVNDDGEYREDADSAATTADVDSKRLQGTKRTREHANDNNSKVARKASPDIASSVVNETNKQGGTQWDWTNEQVMQSDADFFAEFGDFGDFFEGDGLVFGEPPGTAESQAYMFPFDGDGVSTPGTQFDTSDPMRLPILDFPMLEGLEDLEKEQDPGVVVDAKCDTEAPPQIPVNMTLIAKYEAALLFASEYAPIDNRAVQVQETVDQESAYRPESRKASSTAQPSGYVYGATPPPTPKKVDTYEKKLDSRWQENKMEQKAAKYDATSLNQKVGGDKKSSVANITRRFQESIVATDLECALFQVQLHNVKGFAYCAQADEPAKIPETSYKECVSEITDSSDASDSFRKKVPERIAGDADEISPSDGIRPVEVGVWRPVGIPKQQKNSESIASPEIGAASSSEIDIAGMQEIADIIPLLVQQAACLNDISLNGENGDGPLAWLSLHQKLSQQQTSMELTTTSDICDPSIAEISPATVASILQSDMRQAIALAFTDINVSGPLNLMEWCRGKVKLDATDVFSGDSKELVSSITGEPITPPQSAKLASWKLSQETEVDNHTSDETQVPSYAMVPVPTILLGYQEDWLKTSPKSIQYWEKAPFEPYGYPKPVTYYVVCLALDPLLCSTHDFFQQLSNVYETCKLGTHIPANVSAQTSNKRVLPGFVTVEFNAKLKTSLSSRFNTANDYVAAMESGWDISEFRKSLRRVCKSLPVNNATITETDYENSPSTVVYIVSPTSEPSVILQTLMESCQGLAPNLRPQKISTDTKQQLQSVIGFSIGRLALQVVTPDTVMKLSNTPAACLDALKELSFAVYNKLRRIPHKYTEDIQQFATKSRIGGIHGSQASSPLSGLWKDCTNTRNISVLGRDSLLDPGNLRWEKSSWSSSTPSRLLENSPGQSGQQQSTGGQPLRLLYEPLFVLSDDSLLEHASGQISKGRSEDSSLLLGISDNPGLVDGGEPSNQVLSFHCCYAWSRNWQWLISVWTDAQGKMLDVNVLPAPRFTSEKEGWSRELFQLFVQVLQQGQQLLSSLTRPSRINNVIITRIGEFYEAEYQEWQRVFMTDERSWSVLIRPESSENMSSVQQRSLPGFIGLPTSPGASSFGSRSLLSGYSKPEQSLFGSSKLQWSQNYTLATISEDDSLQVLSLADSTVGAAPTTYSCGLATGFGMAKTIASLNGAYLLIPAHGLRKLTLSACKTNKLETPGFGQWIQNRGLTSPVASGYVISGPTMAFRREATQVSLEEEWPCTLHIGLIAHFGNSPSSSIKLSSRLVGGNGLCESTGKLSNKDLTAEIRSVLELTGAEFYGLSWLTISPMYLNRRLALPFHCDVACRVDKLLSYVESEVSGQQ